MSGLIWAGIGKGIADAGSTFGNYMAKDIEATRQDEREALREERLLKRQEALDQLKADREETKAETLKQRVASESVQVQARAADAPVRRDAAALGTLGAQVAGDSPVMPQEEREALIRENPQYREVYRQAGLIGADKMDPRLREADDQSKAALEIGAHSSVIDAYAKQRKDVLDQIRLENTEKRGDQRHTEAMAAITERGRQFDEKKPILQQNADSGTTRAGAAVTSANRPGGSGRSGGGDGSAKLRSTKVDDEGNMIAIMSDGSTKNLNIKSGEFNNRVSNLVTQMGKNDYSFNKLSEEDKRTRAIERLTGSPPSVGTGDNRPSASGPTTKNYSNLWK